MTKASTQTCPSSMKSCSLDKNSPEKGQQPYDECEHMYNRRGERNFFSPSASDKKKFYWLIVSMVDDSTISLG